MEILDNTENTRATMMKDVLDHLIGEEVTIMAHYAITGTLVTYNGYLVHILDVSDEKNYYIQISSIEAIRSSK